MTRAIQVYAIALTTLLATAHADPEPWKRTQLASGHGMISCIAVDRNGVAVGSVEGGVELLDAKLVTKSGIHDPVLGRTGRIFALAWSGGSLWIASEGGLYQVDSSTQQLERTKKNVPASLHAGVRAMISTGEVLWCATSKSVVTFNPARKESMREWKLPIQDDPTSILRVGGRILLGTSTKGLFLLDSASGAWVRLGRSEGLSSDQVTGLEWVGAEVFVATPEGLDILDLSTQKVRALFPNFIVSWMAQSNGSIYVSTVDGLMKVDAATHAFVPVALPSGARSEGALSARNSMLLVASGQDLLSRPLPTIFGQDGFRLVPQGFVLSLPGRVPVGTLLQAFLRIPEWPDAKVELSLEIQDSGSALLVRTPADLRGLVQIDMVASTGSRIDEIRSIEGVGDRVKPSLVVEPFRAVVRDSQMEISGKVSGVGGLDLVLSPSGRKLAVGQDGGFRQRLDLRSGDNRFELRLDDGIGNSSTREIKVRRDDRAPVLDPVPDDTVSGDFSRIRVKFHDAGVVKATARGTSQVRVSVFDSFVVVESRKLAVGINPIQILLEDEAGNVSSKIVQVVRRPAAPGTQVSSWSLENFGTTDSRGVAALVGDSSRTVHVVHYNMVEGETLCGVAEMFYGSQGLAEILIRWNGFADSSQWRRMPVGTPVGVPFWRDLDYRNPDVKALLESFPWDRIPLGPRNKK